MEELRSLVNPVTFFSSLYHLGEVIAFGAFGIIYEANCKRTLSPYVAKVIRINELESEQIFLLIKELRVLQSVNHPNLVQYIDSFISDSSLYIVLEYCEVGAISEIYYDVQKPLSEPQIIFMLHEVLQNTEATQIVLKSLKNSHKKEKR
eukprot:TRINITY_DN478_c0_g2_i27.p1 TRINITY_DN478_c0_g2~~TRINITY_DN478_c0_g2_i27.p1  ORF type:complete len:149 (+),score=16.14 TRINITY_DN478_c0_g2_i27:302-748(+)